MVSAPWELNRAFIFGAMTSAMITQDAQINSQIQE
jgi:hypothetical protein